MSSKPVAKPPVAKPVAKPPVAKPVDIITISWIYKPWSRATVTSHIRRNTTFDEMRNSIATIISSIPSGIRLLTGVGNLFAEVDYDSVVPPDTQIIVNDRDASDSGPQYERDQNMLRQTIEARRAEALKPNVTEPNSGGGDDDDDDDDDNAESQIDNKSNEHRSVGKRARDERISESLDNEDSEPSPKRRCVEQAIEVAKSAALTTFEGVLGDLISTQTSTEAKTTTDLIIVRAVLAPMSRPKPPRQGFFRFVEAVRATYITRGVAAPSTNHLRSHWEQLTPSLRQKYAPSEEEISGYEREVNRWNAAHGLNQQIRL
jgi:hypothetical protein